MTNKRKEPPEREIATAIYDSLKANGYKLPSYGAVAKRVADILREEDDFEKVKYVCLVIADRDGPEFSAWHSLGWGTYEYLRDQINIPDGFWRFALWRRDETDEKVALSIDYWIGRAQDGFEDGDSAAIDEAFEMLDKLWAKKVFSEMTWN